MNKGARRRTSRTGRAAVGPGLLAGMVLGVLPVTAPHGAELTSDAERVGYVIGRQIGANLKQDGIEFDREALYQGIGDALTGAAPRLDPEEAKAAMQRAAARQQKRQNAAAEENRAAGNAYRAQYGARDDVTVTDSGLQYRVIEGGDGPPPAASDTVTVNYRGRTIDGEEFDSSYRRGEPASFRVDQVIPGWQEALQLMRPGAKWEVVVPPDLAYAERGAGSVIGPGETLIFDIELLGVE